MAPAVGASLAAIVQISKIKKSDQQFLEREIATQQFSQSGNRFKLFPFITNPDPVLLYLATSDERAYRIMERNDTAVSAARTVRDNNLLSGGTAIKTGKSKSPAAKMLRDFTIGYFDGIESLITVQRKIMDALYWGWRPMEKVYRPFNFKRKTYLVPYKIIDKNPEHFRFTPERFLCHFDWITGEFTVFDTPADQLKFCVFTYGGIDNPYGEGVYQKVWLMHYAKDRFFEMFSQGMQRSMGMLKVKQGLVQPGSGAMQPGNSEVILSDVAGQVQQMVDLLNSKNVLVEKFGWTVEFLNNISFADGWIKAIEYVEKQINTVIATESLSFKEAQFGSRAQAIVHAESGNKTAALDGRYHDDWINEQIIRPTLEFNFGEIDPQDMPRMVSRARIPVDMNQVKLASDMGMEFDADQIAEQFNLPIADDETKNRIGGTPAKTPGPVKQDVTGNPKKQVQKAEEAVRNK